MELQGSRCVVTGASSGIGFAVAERLLRSGAQVTAASRSITAQMFDPGYHDQLHVYSGDLSEPQEVDHLLEFAHESMGSIDLFFANAGRAYFENRNRSNWSRMEDIFALNVFSPVFALTKLMERKGNDPFFFLVTASGMSHIALPGYALYAGTKAAIHQICDSMRFQLGRGQILSVVYPIATETGFFQKAGAENKPWPVQPVDVVADRIILGIEQDQETIIPFRPFYYSLPLFLLIKPLRRLYQRLQQPPQ